MKTLFLTRWRPHDPDGGAPLRNAQNIAAMAALGEVDVLSAGRPEEVRDAPGIRTWRHVLATPQKRRWPGLLTPGHHPLIERFFPESFQSAFAQMIAETAYDLVVVEEISMARAVPMVRAAGLPCVFDAHNVEARLRADIGAGAGLRQRVFDARLGTIEQDTVRAATMTWACSDIDADILRAEYGPQGPVVTVPNGVDVDGYAEQYTAQGAPRDGAGPINLIYIGTMSYAPNADAGRELIETTLPALRAKGLDVRLTMIGRDPDTGLQALAAQDPDVDLTGGVASILPYFAAPALMVLPIRDGSGTRLKILEAFALGCPVISTAKGAEGIDVTHGRDIRLAETTDDIVAAITDLWQSPDAAEAQRAAARDTVTAGYSWAAAGKTIAQALTQAGLR